MLLATGGAKEGLALGRALLLLLAALSSTVLATALSGGSVTCAVAGVWSPESAPVISATTLLAPASAVVAGTSRSLGRAILAQRRAVPSRLLLASVVVVVTGTRSRLASPVLSLSRTRKDIFEGWPSLDEFLLTGQDVL